MSPENLESTSNFKCWSLAKIVANIDIKSSKNFGGIFGHLLCKRLPFMRCAGKESKNQILQKIGEFFLKHFCHENYLKLSRGPSRYDFQNEHYCW